MKRILLVLALLAAPAALAADNIAVTVGSGTTIKTKDVGAGVEESQVLLSDTSGNSILGTAGTANANVLTVQGIASMTPVQDNVTQFGGSNVATGTGAGGSGVPRVTVSNDSTIGLVAGSQIVGKVGIDQTTPGTTNAVNLAPTTANGCTPYHLSGGTAASNNSTNIKGSAGTLCDLTVINTTSTLYYLKLYNLSSAPTCSSATGIVHVYPIPNAAGAGAGIQRTLVYGEAFGTGIGFCVTGGGADTDNTNAATGVFVEASFK
jgi:hypothetical protein